MKKLAFIIGFLLAFALFSQDKNASKYAKTITAEDLKTHLSIIASDEFEGRETGTKGQKLAAAYISDRFNALGFEGPVDGSYFQTFDLIQSELVMNYFQKENERKVGFEDFIYYSNSETRGEEYVKVIVADDKDNLINEYKEKYVVYIRNRLGGSEDRIKKAREAGAKGFVIIVTDDGEFNATMNRFGRILKAKKLSIDKREQGADQMVIGDKNLASWMFDKPFDAIEAGDQAQLIFNADYLDTPVATENVLGYLRGSEKPEELLIITAHYDHIGISNDGEINNGADDDGSGTVTVLEIAEAFSSAAKKNKRPKRSILFMMVTGEEKGLLGSRYYTDIDPVFPLENTVANLNIDMVGRVDDDHKDNPNYIYLIGSDKLSSDLHNLSEEVNNAFSNITLDYTYNDENDPNRFYYRSDHYNFAKNNIPIIFYFNGTHPDYHKPSDEVDKIEFEIMENRARLIFHTAWEIANREKRIEVDK